MFGDDPDPTVMTEQFGFVQFRTRTRGGLWLCKEGVGLRRERRRQPGTIFGDRKRPTKVPATIPLYI